ncbi:hypothetical protein M011DRAFT_195972 [Sporormia fimetaria CBS 119925]|uniref:Uncharacterized protein n=1 Tax=Sporormia fimetaria CBS 119925 TaxID=1340428 RepID=A0A6A6V2T9_9PLEO|nr:hypothetical protein M011DRAFT_195972 [Sporormia fimetaria CBS 119925]
MTPKTQQQLQLCEYQYKQDHHDFFPRVLPLPHRLRLPRPMSVRQVALVLLLLASLRLRFSLSAGLEDRLVGVEDPRVAKASRAGLAKPCRLEIIAGNRHYLTSFFSSAEFERVETGRGKVGDGVWYGHAGTWISLLGRFYLLNLIFLDGCFI